METEKEEKLRKSKNKIGEGKMGKRVRHTKRKEQGRRKRRKGAIERNRNWG